MSTEADTTENRPNEVIEVKGNKLIETVKGIMAQDNASRVIIYRANGDQLLDIPYAGGLAGTALVTLLIPPLAVLTPLALLLGRFKVEIVRPEAEEAPTSSEVTSEAEAVPTSEEATSEAEPTNIAASMEETEAARTNIPTSLEEAWAQPTLDESSASSTKAEVEVEIEPATPAEEPEPDKLQKISGIGKVFEGRLHEAGIYTFAQLAETPAEKIKEIVSPDKADQLFDVEPWIDQARELSQVAF